MATQQILIAFIRKKAGVKIPIVQLAFKQIYEFKKLIILDLSKLCEKLIQTIYFRDIIQGYILVSFTEEFVIAHFLLYSAECSHLGCYGHKILVTVTLPSLCVCCSW